MSVNAEVTHLTERGQVSFPAALRRSMNLRTGQKFRWEPVSPTEVRIHIIADVEADPQKALGFGPRLRNNPARRTADWLKELRASE